MPYETVLFDFDHTLFDSDSSFAAAFDAAALVAGLASTPTHRRRFDEINHSLWRQVEAGELSPNDVKIRRFGRFVDEFELDADPHDLADAFVEALADRGELLPGARSILDQLADVLPLALVTNGIGSVQRGRLRRLGLEEHFEAVVISGEVGTAKPGARIFELAFAELDRPANAAVMVGDGLASDIAGAVAAAIDSVWFNPAGVPNETQHVATHEIRDLAELPPLLTGG